MFGRPSKVKEKNMDNVPSEIIKKISDYLNYSEAFRFSSVSKSYSTILQNKITTRLDWINFIQFRARVYDKTINKALEAIDTYLREDTQTPVPPDIGGYSATDYSIKYTVGHRRAMCFKDILMDEKNSIENRLFALSVLISEPNGKVLKRRVMDEIEFKLPRWEEGFKCSKWLDSYVKAKFGNKVENLTKALLKMIHDRDNGPMPDRIGYEDTFEVGFTRKHFQTVLEMDHEPENASAKVCRIS